MAKKKLKLVKTSVIKEGHEAGMAGKNPLDLECFGYYLTIKKTYAVIGAGGKVERTLVNQKTQSIPDNYSFSLSRALEAYESPSKTKGRRKLSNEEKGSFSTLDFDKDKADAWVAYLAEVDAFDRMGDAMDRDREYFMALDSFKVLQHYVDTLVQGAPDDGDAPDDQVAYTLNQLIKTGSYSADSIGAYAKRIKASIRRSPGHEYAGTRAGLPTPYLPTHIEALVYEEYTLVNNSYSVNAVQDVHVLDALTGDYLGQLDDTDRLFIVDTTEYKELRSLWERYKSEAKRALKKEETRAKKKEPVAPADGCELHYRIRDFAKFYEARTKKAGKNEYRGMVAKEIKTLRKGMHFSLLADCINQEIEMPKYLRVEDVERLRSLQQGRDRKRVLGRLNEECDALRSAYFRA
jgi:hypothetical protein